ncbi:DUF1007 family protein [Microbaculum marinum]|uniref:DUF1007 family protein n=1 Tax=Microbaculum marinum TaxID=1764581 RepID=A0AAW9S146_9HYPH
MSLALWLIAFASAVTGGPAEAHPHLWIESRSDVLFDAEGAITAVRHTWTFDEMYSAYAIQGLDSDGDGMLSRRELEPVNEANVESLAEYEYFTFLRVVSDDPVQASFSAPTDSWTEFDGSVLSFQFTLPLEEPIDPARFKTGIDVFDPAYFVGFTFADDNPVRLVDAPEACRSRTGRARGFDEAIAGKLAQIPATGELPPDLLDLTVTNANTIRVICN